MKNVNSSFLVCYWALCLILLLASACETQQPTAPLALATPSVVAKTTQAREVTSVTTPTETQLATDTPIPSQTPTATEPAPTAVPTKGKSIVVNSTADSGPGTLRQALLDAQGGDTITFDPAMFPPQAHPRIILASCLPEIKQDHLTVDGSSAGVVLDGSQIEAEWCSGIRIISTNWNTIQGLRFESFSPGAGIEMAGGAQHNLIKENIIGFGDVGFVLSGKETSLNAITGNFIGVDSQDKNLEQASVGIWIEDGASHNTIADNVIAYNSHGIEIVDSNSVGNTITQNSIYGNLHGGIGLKGVDQGEDGDFSLRAPTIIVFDLENGTIAGFTCPNCLVEIFSDERNQGRIFESSIAADGAGNFSLNQGAPFTGPYLTATATDGHGTTSPFSVQTFGSSKRIILQEENNLPITLFQPIRSQELEDNRIGIMLSPELDRRVWMDADYFLHKVNIMGVKRVRLSIDYFDLEEVNWEEGTYSTYSIEPNHDRLINGLIEMGIKARLCLNFWDPESPGKIYTEGYYRFKNDDEIQRYVGYVRFVVNHFKGKIAYYEILNEPSPHPGTQRSIEAEDYIKVVRRVIQIIREADPEAGIVVGAIPNLYGPGDYEYLLSILNSEIMPLVDGISFHPMHGVSPNYELKEDYYRYPSVVQGIKETAYAQGFEGQYFADELVWRTVENPLPSEPWTYSELGAAKYYARGIVTQLGLDLITGTTQPGFDDIFSPERVIGKVIQNLSTVMAGAEPSIFSVGIYGENTDIRSYLFSLSSGEKLLALWTDGVAVDDDPGIPVTLTLPGFAEHKVIGIDVLYGIEQELIADEEDGNLVIHNLFVKDYPLIVRLSK
jgi:parallel beta-helix repeat protein